MFLSLEGVFIVCGDWSVSSLDAEQLTLDRTMKDAQPPSVHGSVKLNRVQNPHWTFADFSANRAGRSRTSISKKKSPGGAVKNRDTKGSPRQPWRRESWSENVQLW